MISSGSTTLAGNERCGLLHQEVVAALCQGHPDVIFHLAGAGVPWLGEDDGIQQYYANVATTEALICAIEQCSFRGCVVFASSASVYGNSGPIAISEDAVPHPCTPYGAAKLRAEATLSTRIGSTCDVRIARLFHVFGPGQPKLVVFDLIRRLIEGERPLVVRSTGNEIRDFVFVDDAVRALLFLGSEAISAGPPLVVNVASGYGTRLRELARDLLALSDRSDGKFICRPSSHANPIGACVGDAARLRALGLLTPRATHAQLQATVTWVEGYGAA